MRSQETYIRLVGWIANFIANKQDGVQRTLLIGHDKDYVITVRAIKKTKSNKPKEKLIMFIDEYFEEQP